MLSDVFTQQVHAHFRDRGEDAFAVAGLGRCVDALASATDLSARLSAWVALIEWARTGQGPSTLDGEGMLQGTALRRWHMLFDFLDVSPAARGALQASLADILHESESTNLFGVAGLPGERGFLAEFSDRLVRRVLPAPADEHDLARLLYRLYRTSEQVERFARLPPGVFERIAELFVTPDHGETWRGVARDFADGFRLLSARVLSEGLSEKVRARCRPGSVAALPVFRLNSASETLVQTWQSGADLSAPAQAWRAQRSACREEMEQVAHRLERDGVSVDIVYAMEAIERCLTRMDLMLTIMETPSGAQRLGAIHDLLALLIAANHRDRSLRHLISTNLQLLQRKIVERSGQAGEHYIAWTRAEYRSIWLAAAGGGLLTVFTAAFKTSIAGFGAPPFVTGLLSGLNYALSFLLLQYFGLILATKQPAMTAAALATIMRSRRGGERLDEVVNYAVQIVRSQLAAALGNVLVVSLGAYVFSALWLLALGHPFLDPREAQHVFDTLSPVTSLTVWYAALTGAILWAASLIGGWFDNWAAYHRLPQAIADHPLGQRFGRERMVRLAGTVSRNIAGWGTNVSLGLMLGLVPVLGAFFGLPLDVRHVTLNSGTLSLATAAMGARWFGGFLLWAAAGIGTMFVLNLGVSFMLSLYTAARAFGLPRGFLWDFARHLGRQFLRRPRDFVLPPPKSQ